MLNLTLVFPNLLDSATYNVQSELSNNSQLKRIPKTSLNCSLFIKYLCERKQWTCMPCVVRLREKQIKGAAAVQQSPLVYANTFLHTVKSEHLTHLDFTRLQCWKIRIEIDNIQRH